MNTFTSGLWLNTDFCVSRDEEEVFMSGQSGPHNQFVIQRYKRTGQLLNTWQVKCGDDTTKHLLHLSIGGTPYIAMSCCECKSILLYSKTDSDPITAYTQSRSDLASPYAMYHGPDNTILAISHKGGSREVLVYDVTSAPFTLKDRMSLDVDMPLDIHYMETEQHGRIVILSNKWNKEISAHSIESKALVWKIENKEIDGKVFQPYGMCSDPETGTLYVGDRENDRLIIIEPNTGEVSTKVPGVKYINNIAWCPVQPHLVVRHDADEITYFNIK